MMFDDTDASVG